MKPPKSVKVGHATYDLQPSEPHDSWARGVYGDMNYAHLRIRYNKALPPQAMAEVILHEVLHAIYSGWNVAEDDKEEAVVSKVAMGLSAVMRDNPRLVAWVQEALGK